MATYFFIAVLIMMVGVLSFIMSRIIHRMNEIEQQYEMVVSEFARLTDVAINDAKSIADERAGKAEEQFKKASESFGKTIQRIDGAIAEINRREIGTADTSEFARVKTGVTNHERRIHFLEKKLKKKKDPVEYQEGLVGVHLEPDEEIDQGGEEK